MAKSLQSQLGLGLAQAQTAVQNAQAYNTANANEAGRFQIQGGATVGGTGAIGQQALSTPSSSISSSSAPASQSSVSRISTPVATPTAVGAIPARNSASGSTTPGVAPNGLKTETVKSYTSPVAPTVAPLATLPTQAPVVSTIDQKPLSLIQIRDQIKTSNPNFSNLQATQEARKQFDVQRSVANKATVLPGYPKTGISAIDTAQQKLRDEALQKIKDTQKNYAISQADYQKNAGYYTNFGDTNSKFNNVLGDIANTLANTKNPMLSDQEMQVIATKNGVTVDEIKNPLNIYKNLEMTDEGKQVLGVTDRQNQINDMQTANDRAKEDAKINLDRATTNLNYQIQDAERIMKQNTDWMTASGAWSGSGRSSGHEKGIQNIKDDTGRVIERINEQMGNLNTDNSKYLTRLLDDFTNNSTRAKTALDTDVKNLKFDAGLKLNGLEEKYGKGSKELLKQLDSIVENFGVNSLDIQGKYLDNVGKMIKNTDANLGLITTMNTVTSALKNKRYNELTANNGALLQNISLTNIADEVKAGHMDMGKYADTRNLMISTVTSALQKSGKEVTQDDLNVITHLIDNGATPAQAIARITGGNIVNPTYTGGTLGDMRKLGYDANGVPKANGFAWAKNNNPAGLTWNANFENKTPGSLADRLAKKGIQFIKGTERGPGEGGQYVQFASMDDGMEALRTLWEISGEKGQTVGDRLKSFSVAGYTLPVDLGANFNNLSTKDQNELIMLQVQKESPKLYEEMKARGVATPGATTEKEYSTEQKAIMDDYLKNPSDATNQKTMSMHNLRSNDITAYEAQKSAVSAYLSPDEQSLVGALQNYTLDPTKLPGGMSKEGQASRKRILAAAFSDPNYDMKKYPAQQKFMNNWTSGKLNDNKIAFSTAVGHLGGLNDMIEQMNQSGLPVVNAVSNWVSQATGSPKITDFDALRSALAEEIAKTLKGNASPTEVEIAAWDKKIGKDFSDAQLKGVMKEVANILQSRFDSLDRSYQTTMGKSSIEDPDMAYSVPILDSISGKKSSGGSSTGSTPDQSRVDRIKAMISNQK